MTTLHSLSDLKPKRFEIKITDAESGNTIINRVCGGKEIYLSQHLFDYLVNAIWGKFPSPAQSNRQLVKVLTRLGLVEKSMIMGGNQAWVIVPTQDCETWLRENGFEP